MEMKIYIYAILAIIAIESTPARGNSASTAEGSAVSALQDAIESYSGRNDGHLSNQWSDLFRSPIELTIIDQSVTPSSVSELYVFITDPQRDLFPNGKLLLIRVVALPWPNAWKTSTNIGGYSIDDLTRANKEEIEKSRGHQKPIRYIIFQDKRGTIRSDWWYEEKIQGMLSQTGIVVPLPTPYRQTPQTPPGEKSVSTIKSNAPAVATDAAPQTKPTEVPAPSPTSAPTRPTKQPAKPVWWIVGLIMLAAGVLFVTRKKPKY
jgi:hypothetical protein